MVNATDYIYTSSETKNFRKDKAKKIISSVSPAWSTVFGEKDAVFEGNISLVVIIESHRPNTYYCQLNIYKFITIFYFPYNVEPPLIHLNF